MSVFSDLSWIRPHLKEDVDSLEPKLILDLGATGSVYHGDIARTGRTLVGVDFRENPINMGEHHYVLDAAAMNDKFESKFDLLIAINFYPFVGTGAYGNPEGISAEEMYVQNLRLLKKSGSIIFNLPIGAAAMFQHAAGPIRLFSLGQVKAWLVGTVTKELYLERTPKQYVVAEKPTVLDGAAYGASYPLGFAYIVMKRPSRIPDVGSITVDTPALLPKDPEPVSNEFFEAQLEKATQLQDSSPDSGAQEQEESSPSS